MTHIEAMKVEGPLHVVCQCDKCKAEKQEPVACQHKRYSIDVTEQIGTCIDCGSEGRMRFVVDDTHPQPKREWVGLTDEEIQAVLDKPEPFYDTMFWFARTIERKLKQKNGYNT